MKAPFPTRNLVEDIESSGWEQLVDIKGVVVNQVETECGQRGVFATLKCLGSHLSRNYQFLTCTKQKVKNLQIDNLDTESFC